MTASKFESYILFIFHCKVIYGQTWYLENDVPGRGTHLQCSLY